VSQQKNEMKLSPIALFTFKRPEHTRRTLESLAQNPEFTESPLFIYCDGARNEADIGQVMKTRQLVSDWPHPNKTIIERDQNWGLANSIIDGVTFQCNEHGKIVVLEDDMVVSEHFLEYMNAALVKFQNDERVISIHGYSFPIEGLPEAFFIAGASCWGWATWKRGWDLFESDGKKLLDQLIEKKLMHRFNIEGTYPYQRMLLDQIHGRNDSWAIRWYASALVRQKLTLHPGRSLVTNIGLDGSGTHCDSDDELVQNLAISLIDISCIEVVEDRHALYLWSRYFKLARRKKLLKTITSLNLLVRTLRRRLHFCRYGMLT
jgi:GR25 family glycosyltransferase involved in LPS biosynthesis